MNNVEARKENARHYWHELHQKIHEQRENPRMPIGATIGVVAVAYLGINLRIINDMATPFIYDASADLPNRSVKDIELETWKNYRKVKTGEFVGYLLNQLKSERQRYVTSTIIIQELSGTVMSIDRHLEQGGELTRLTKEELDEAALALGDLRGKSQIQENQEYEGGTWRRYSPLMRIFGKRGHAVFEFDGKDVVFTGNEYKALKALAKGLDEGKQFVGPKEITEEFEPGRTGKKPGVATVFQTVERTLNAHGIAFPALRQRELQVHGYRLKDGVMVEIYEPQENLKVSLPVPEDLRPYFLEQAEMDQLIKSFVKNYSRLPKETKKLSRKDHEELKKVASSIRELPTKKHNDGLILGLTKIEDMIKDKKSEELYDLYHRQANRGATCILDFFSKLKASELPRIIETLMPEISSSEIQKQIEIKMGRTIEILVREDLARLQSQKHSVPKSIDEAIVDHSGDLSRTFRQFGNLTQSFIDKWEKKLSLDMPEGSIAEAFSLLDTLKLQIVFFVPMGNLTPEQRRFLKSDQFRDLARKALLAFRKERLQTQ